MESCVRVRVFFGAKFSLPWDQTTLVGYVKELGFLIATGFGFFSCYAAFLLLFISICQHHQAFYKMIKHSVNKLKRSDQNRCGPKFLRDLMRFHISIKR